MPCYSTPFSSTIWWHHLDFSSIGTEKQFVGLDLVAVAPRGVDVSVGFDQRDLDARTEDYLLEDDTLPGHMIAIPVAGPSFDLRLTFRPDQAWEWSAALIYIQDMGGGR